MAFSKPDAQSSSRALLSTVSPLSCGGLLHREPTALQVAALRPPCASSNLVASATLTAQAILVAAVELISRSSWGELLRALSPPPTPPSRPSRRSRGSVASGVVNHLPRVLHFFLSSRKVANIAPPYGENRSHGVPCDKKQSRYARKIAATKLATDFPHVTSSPNPPSSGALTPGGDLRRA